MKKNYVYALMGAIALTGAVSFSACSSSDEIIDNPDYNPETKSVKTTITLSVNPANVSSKASTRQAASIVQQGTDFRGIKNILFVPSSSEITTSTSTTDKISLDDLESFETGSTNYKLYSGKDVKTQVSQFLFLGQAKNNAAPNNSSTADKLAKGFTTNTFSSLTSTSTVGDVKINPVQILVDPSTGDWKTQSEAITTYLGTIVTALGESTNFSLNSIINKFKRERLTAGSANAVLLTLEKLYQEVSAVTGDDAVASIQDAITATNMAAIESGEGITAKLKWSDGCTFKGFPTALGLPEGSASYKWDASSSKFKYETGTEGNAVSTAVNDFVYPNELYYLTNSPIRTSSSKTVEWPKSVPLWTSETWSEWGSSVDGNTKNIALKYNIQYGSALLATQVKYGATKLYDNSKANGEETNKEISVSDGTFTLTGVIIGGQPTEVGWNCLPSSTTFTRVVYDRLDNNETETGLNVTSSYPETPNYTLVFDDYKVTVANVNVCLEFKNNSNVDFYGKDGVILAGQKFYLIGQLDVENKDNPFNAEGENAIGTDDDEDTFFPSRVHRAFIQDFTTTAQFVISGGSSDGNGDGSLAKALSTIPDLRASSQNIGLSVDLTWRSGAIYENVILGQ